MTPRLPSRTPLALILGVLSWSSATGCGFILTKGPPRGYEQMDTFSCTESNVGPILDMLPAGFFLTLGVTAIAANEDFYDTTTTELGAGLLLWAALYGSSAAVGFGKTSRCREALRQLTDFRDRTPPDTAKGIRSAPELPPNSGPGTWTTRSRFAPDPEARPSTDSHSCPMNVSHEHVPPFQKGMGEEGFEPPTSCL